MRTLYLLRHAKATTARPPADRERGLSERGRAACLLIGAYLQTQRPAVQKVLCSAARRTRETLEQLRPSLKPGLETEIEEDLYLAPAPVLLKYIQRCDDRFASLLLIAHNPGLQALAGQLSEGCSGALARSLRAAFPTSALAVLDFETESWALCAPGTGFLRDFVTPATLASPD